MSVPDWVQDAVFYQIFPDRFANGDPTNDPANVRPWLETPTTWGFHGGDLQGITQKMDYLVDLGITAVYLNPIFQATSNHRYNTTDYYKIDPKLGTMADFTTLIETAHRSGIRVILDGVFNHCGRGFFAFNDILENQEHSPYLDWFHISNFPVDGYSPGDARDYLGWWNIKSLPKFNTDNPHVRAYLLDVAQYWIRQGADGWRMDVPNEIDDDAFWGDFRRLVRAENPEAYLLGEIWNLDARWVGDRHFDGLMHYPFRDAVLRLLQTGTLDVPHFVEKLEQLTQYYDPQNTRAMLTLLSSHDVERLLTKLENDLEKTRLAYLLQFTFPGAPSIYYGDEIGLYGGKDPGCRGAFPWDVKKWDNSLRDWVKDMIRLRKEHPVLRRGDFKTLELCPHQSCCGFMRVDDKTAILVAVNASSQTHELHVPITALPFPAGRWENQTIKSLLYNSINHMKIDQGVMTLKLAPWQGEVISI